jgi:hypothetical protein
MPHRIETSYLYFSIDTGAGRDIFICMRMPLNPPWYVRHRYMVHEPLGTPPSSEGEGIERNSTGHTSRRFAALDYDHGTTPN